MKEESLKPFATYLEELAYHKSRFDIFDDFLTMMVCALSMERKEEEYLRTVKGYSRNELDVFCKAFASVVMEMEYHPLTDPFGDYFQEHISHGHNGQFFTPHHVCDLMAGIVQGCNKGQEDGSTKKINDPACGSGRLILSSAKYDRTSYFVGCDISATCCKMTLVNMCLNSLKGEVHHMDTLSQKTWRKWRVIIDRITKIPFIYEEQEVRESEPPALAADTRIKTEAIEVIEQISPLQTANNKSGGFVRFTAKA